MPWEFWNMIRSCALEVYCPPPGICYAHPGQLEAPAESNRESGGLAWQLQLSGMDGAPEVEHFGPDDH